MDQHWGIALVGIGVGVLQALIITLLMGIKTDIGDIWTRLYDHYHEVECDNNECTALKTGNVVVPGTGGNRH